MTPLPKTSSAQVTAEYSLTDVRDYDGNPLIEALGPLLSDDEAMKKMRRKPLSAEVVRNKSAVVRHNELQSIMKLVFPFFSSKRYHRLFDTLLRQGLVGRNPMDPDYWQRTRSVDEIAPEMLVKAKNGRLTSTPGGSLIVGVSGMGKTGLLAVTLDLYRKGVYIHGKYHDTDLNLTQIPFVICECNHNTSVLGLFLLILLELSRLAGKNLRREFTEPLSSSTLAPFVVKKLIEYNVGMVVIDEAQNVTAQSSGGERGMLYFFINLMNTSGVPFMLMGNPEILPAFDLWMKAGIRFSAGGRMDLERMDKAGEWTALAEYMWKYQYLKNFTPMSTELLQAIYDYSQGVPELTLLTYKWAQELAIARGGDEVLTPLLVQEAFELNAKSLKPIVQAFRLNTQESLKEFQDLGRPVRFKRKITLTPPTSKDPASTADKPATTSTTGKKSSQGEKLAKRGRVDPKGLICYGKKEVRGEMSTYAILKQDGYIAESTEFWS